MAMGGAAAGGFRIFFFGNRCLFFEALRAETGIMQSDGLRPRNAVNLYLSGFGFMRHYVLRLAPEVRPEWLTEPISAAQCMAVPDTTGVTQSPTHKSPAHKPAHSPTRRAPGRPAPGFWVLLGLGKGGATLKCSSSYPPRQLTPISHRL
jgi:hypothetical protein